MICRSHDYLQPLLLCLMPCIDGCSTLEMRHAWITLAHTSSRCIMHVCLKTLDVDDLSRGVLSLQQAVNQLGREELLQQLCYSRRLDTRNCKSSLLSKALCGQRPFIIKGPVLLKEKKVTARCKGVHLRLWARWLKVGLQRATIPLSPPHQALDIPLHQQ